MKMRMATILTATAVLLSVPASAFAYTPLQTQSSSIITPLAHDEWNFVVSGEDEVTFDYEKSDGVNLRVWLGDDERVGMELLVYDPKGNLFASGNSTSRADYQVKLETKPKIEGTYKIKVVVNDGGGPYWVSLAARSY
ncbi:hypothetical protein [Paenibacillus sp. ISL-20]|uniref:hypothetical protein n=1 Tax=Paenibacillus sp. ISL-20 TaxID=2819163 RepID=UPI001BE9493B|nr:hypothetical protein [Paenibacillus sp. ISL-20]MBT2761401.1 hypothetical protein [Paenibacillus sp. ISL-20]